MSKLKEKYEFIVNEYIKEFCDKQELDFDFWLGDQIGGIAFFGDALFFNFTDIVFDINSEQPKNLIIDWIYDSIDNSDVRINYYSYSKGLRFNDLKK